MSNTLIQAQQSKNKIYALCDNANQLLIKSCQINSRWNGKTVTIKPTNNFFDKLQIFVKTLHWKGSKHWEEPSEEATATLILAFKLYKNTVIDLYNLDLQNSLEENKDEPTQTDFFIRDNDKDPNSDNATMQMYDLSKKVNDLWKSNCLTKKCRDDFQTEANELKKFFDKINSGGATRDMMFGYGVFNVFFLP